MFEPRRTDRIFSCKFKLSQQENDALVEIGRRYKINNLGNVLRHIIRHYINHPPVE